MVTINLRNVPEDLRLRFEAHAASAGLTVSEYLRQELFKLAAEDAHVVELRARIQRRSAQSKSI